MDPGRVRSANSEQSRGASLQFAKAWAALPACSVYWPITPGGSRGHRFARPVTLEHSVTSFYLNGERGKFALFDAVIGCNMRTAADSNTLDVATDRVQPIAAVLSP